MSSRNIHVVHRNGEWIVRREGNTRATSIYSTQKDAVEAARKQAEIEGTEVVIHGRDGRIRERDNYSNDPIPPRQTRKVLMPKSNSQTPRKKIEEAVRKVIQETGGTL